MFLLDVYYQSLSVIDIDYNNHYYCLFVRESLLLLLILPFDFVTLQIVIRIRCDAEIVQCPLGIKFGCDAVTEAPNLIHVSRSLDLDVVGVSFHVGSGCQDSPVYLRAIRLARELFDLAIKVGFKPYLLDIGGGYPGAKDSSIDKMADIINQGIDECFNSKFPLK